MSSSQMNFYKPNSSKIKLSHIYPYDSFRPGNIPEVGNRGKSSISHNKLLNQKDILLSKRNNSYQNCFNSYNIPFKYNDMDKLAEELSNFKIELNKKNKEIHGLKIAYAKLDEENIKNMHIIEEVIIEANRHRKNIGDGFKFNPEDLEREIKNCLSYSVTSDKLIVKLLESHSINNLKRQIFEYKNLLASKDEEISNFKANSRITRFQEIDGKLKSTIDELIHLKENYAMLMNLYNEKETRFRELLEERDSYKSMNQKLKFQNEEFKDRLMIFQETNAKLNENLKVLEEKNSNFKYQISNFKTQIKEKETEISKIKSEILIIENYRLDKEKNENFMKNLNLKIISMKEDLENKSNKLSEVQKINTDLKQKLENYEISKFDNLGRNKDEIFGKKNYLDSIESNKEKIIKNLENENVNLRKEIIKLNDDLINKADHHLTNFEKEFLNKNTNEIIQSEINQLFLDNKKEEMSQFEKNLEKELNEQDDLDSENKFSELSKPFNILVNKDIVSERSYCSKKDSNGNVDHKNNQKIKANIDNNRYYEELIGNENNNIIQNLSYKNETTHFKIKNQENMKHSINSLSKEENNFNYSDLKNKNEIDDENPNCKEDILEIKPSKRVKRPENKKNKNSKEKEIMNNQMLIDEENRNLNSFSDNNIKNKLFNKEYDAYDEYLKEFEELGKENYLERCLNKSENLENFDKIKTSDEDNKYKFEEINDKKGDADDEKYSQNKKLLNSNKLANKNIKYFDENKYDDYLHEDEYTANQEKNY